MSERSTGDRLAPVVAVLIMVVSLAAAGFAFLDSQARSRTSAAGRRADAAGVDVLRETVLREREIGQQLIIYGYGNDLGWIGFSLANGTYSGSSYAIALASAYDAARIQAETFSTVIGSEYQQSGGLIEWPRFIEESRRPAYRAVEVQKAYSEVAGAWGAKSSKYVAIITILAAALFLLGLTVSVVPESRGNLVGMGVGLAVVASLWGAAVWSTAIPGISERAIDAYVDGAIAENASQAPEDLRFAERRLDDAIEANPRYREAYLARGYARFQLDLGADDGPSGSLPAVEDFQAALALDADDPIAWANLGAAWFWLGEYDASEEATRRALEIDPDNAIMNLNLAALLAIKGDPGYDPLMDRVGELLVAFPSWERQAVVTGYLRVLDLAELYRPDISFVADDMHQALVHMDREISIGRRFFGSPTPEPIAATFGAPDMSLGLDGSSLRVDFDYTGVATGQRFIYRSYLDGVEREDLSMAAATPWALVVPDGSAFIDLTLAEGFRGHTFRIELYLEGNLVAIGELSAG